MFEFFNWLFTNLFNRRPKFPFHPNESTVVILD